MRPKPTILEAVATAALLTGCAHYDFVDKTTPGADHREDQSGRVEPVSVWTVAAPADEHIDQARLTRVLVGSLRHRGVAAHWTSGPGRAAIRCSVVSAGVDGFDGALFARAEVACRMDRGEQSVHRCDASGWSTTHIRRTPSALVNGYARMQEAAAVDALDAVVPRIVDWAVGGQSGTDRPEVRRERRLNRIAPLGGIIPDDASSSLPR